jgi:23S rRNA G2069 N7-methylase RlmK/C1962 C5-methylase RlmI
LRRAAVADRRWDGGALDADLMVEGRELACRYPLRPFSGLATGLYVDQRATRIWLKSQAAGRRVLNLFAYTGAFSISMLAAGASYAVDVDLAAPALARAAEAAVLNGVADRHRIVQQDCRKYLAAGDDRFGVIICDPPTAAQGGDGWVLRRDYPEVLRLALRRLQPGGLFLACCNTIGGKPYALDAAVDEAAQDTGLDLETVDAPALGDDLPLLRGFPEGRPFRLVAVRRKGD